MLPCRLPVGDATTQPGRCGSKTQCTSASPAYQARYTSRALESVSNLPRAHIPVPDGQREIEASLSDCPLAAPLIWVAKHACLAALLAERYTVNMLRMWFSVPLGSRYCVYLCWPSISA